MYVLIIKSSVNLREINQFDLAQLKPRKCNLSKSTILIFGLSA